MKADAPAGKKGSAAPTPKSMKADAPAGKKGGAAPTPVPVAPTPVPVAPTSAPTLACAIRVEVTCTQQGTMNGCINIPQRNTNCDVNLEYSVELCNDGPTTLTVLDFGYELNSDPPVPLMGSMIQPMMCLPAQIVNSVINACIPISVDEIRVSAQGQTPSGIVCSQRAGTGATIAGVGP
jgi:hypothetical protein